MKAVILCDGALSKKTSVKDKVSQSDLFIAADGGAKHARQLSLQPDVIIGDLDSYNPDGNETAEVIHDADQETNDLEKALYYAKKQGCTHITVFGATGQRLDHTLKNLSVMKQFNNQFDSLVFKDHYSEIRLIRSPFSEQFPVGTSISLFPLSGRVEGITTKGLKYPLKNEFLENGVRDGTSNQTVEKKVEIEFKNGDLLLFINHNNRS